MSMTIKISNFIFRLIKNTSETKRKSNCIKKNKKIEITFKLYYLALSKLSLTISEKLLESPVLLHGRPVSIVHADGIG